MKLIPYILMFIGVGTNLFTGLFIVKELGSFLSVCLIVCNTIIIPLGIIFKGEMK